ncbi:MAG: hypothetical protein HPY72_02990 [Anaerolineae bacterium]|jgi:hypothetical protein|nr:hypothetical protein [Anaerolineae bacterium]
MFNVTFPTLILGSIIAGLIGALIHLIAGGKLVRLVFCMVFAWIGFWGGNSLAQRFGLTILTYGQINYAPAIAASVLTSLFGYWLSGENTESEE